ncbi:MAG TPA: 2-oxo-4-hydroxy-4-carboxy-5-ureidoimidazoline decarboxylase [Gemmatimonadales bacterium]|nr:2-oxo-4-hydroxy-4-carboxy-5-ureidoimidazoline decarboxylase [Gemmatimonadales bacterium]
MKVADFNRMTDEKASTVMVNCCGASRWVRGMLAGRPYSGLTALLARADREWRDTGPDDWKEAFAHHPRLGETRTETPVGEAARRWSSLEQEGLVAADDGARHALAQACREYEARFGRIYIVSASGRGPEELLQDLRGRMANTPEQELAIAAAELGNITRQRLGRIFADAGADNP